MLWHDLSETEQAQGFFKLHPAEVRGQVVSEELVVYCVCIKSIKSAWDFYIEEQSVLKGNVKMYRV